MKEQGTKTLKFVDTFDAESLKEQMLKDQPKRGGKRLPAVWLTLGSGDKVLARILPAWTDKGPNAGRFFMKIAQHWDVGPEKKRVICPFHMSEKQDPCFVCEQNELLYKTGDSVDKKRAQRMRAGKSFIYQVIDREDEFWVEQDEEVVEDPSLLGQPKIKFMRLPWDGHSQIMDFCVDPSYGNISHPLTGIDLRISRTGTDLDTRYNVNCNIVNGRIDRRPIWGTEEDPDIKTIQNLLDRLYDLDEHPFFRVNTYEETVAMFKGQEIPSNKALSSSSSTKAGMLPAASQLGNIESWYKQKEGFSPLNRKEVSKWASAVYKQELEEGQISECYAEEPDHTDEGCQNCPLKGPCVATFFHLKGKSSIAEQNEKSTGLSLAGKSKTSTSRVKEEVEEEKEEAAGVEDMLSYLESKSKK